MMIRSKNKEVLVDLGVQVVHDIRERKIRGKREFLLVIGILGEESGVVLGAYDTKEKAMQALDDIGEGNENELKILELS